MMKKFKRFFASFLCVCMIITSCPDILAWAAGDTAVVKPTKYKLTTETLSKMVRKADRDKTEDNGLCKLKLPAGYIMKSPKMQVYLQPDEENLVFLFVNRSKKTKAAALIVDDKMSDIIAVPTIQELLDEEYATDSNSDFEEDTNELLDDDFMDMTAEILDASTTESDNDADKEYGYLDGEAFSVVLKNGTAGAGFVVSLDELGLDDMGVILPAEEDEERTVVIASDSNSGSAVVLPGKDTVVVPGADTPVVLPEQEQKPVVVDLPVATPSNSNVTVATPSNVSKTFIKELNGVKIKAHAPAGVIPDEATFEAIELKETGDTADAYKEACATLDADEETEYDGVMAYDLHFLLDGEEIQPDGEVQITMEVSEKALPENVDPESLEVKHLDETSGTVEVVTVADTGDKAEGTVAVNEAVMAASEDSEVAAQKTVTSKETAVTVDFGVNSFSFFLITYLHSGIDPELQMKMYDDSGNEMVIDGLDKGNGYGNFPKYNPANLNTGHDSKGNELSRYNCWISIDATAATFGQYTKEYTYLGAYSAFDETNKKFSNPIKWFYYKQGSRNSDGYYWSSAENQPTEDPTISSLNTGNFKKQKEYYTQDSEGNRIKVTLYGDVYLKYVKNKDFNSEIKSEELGTNGWLTYQFTEEGYTEDDIEYKWFRGDIDSKNNFVSSGEVEPKIVTGSTKNIVRDANGTHLYPALDLDENNVNTRRWYQVKVYKKGEEKPIYETRPIQVPYYAALQNGSFENPKIKELFSDGYLAVPMDTDGLEWKTTGEDELVEIVHSADSAGSYGFSDGMADGDQCAELNAEAEGTLYQTVLTTPNSKLYWKLSHRARTFSPKIGQVSGGADVMYLIIAPTVKASEYKTQEQIKKLIDSNNRAELEAQGYFFMPVSTSIDKKGWNVKRGEYTVPSGQYLTNFFFVAYSTASGDATVGNLLDDVSFSTEMPAPNPEYANIEFRKIVEGIRPEHLSVYRVKIKLQERGANGVWTDTGKETTLNFKNGVNMATGLFENVDPNKEYRVLEEPYFTDSSIREKYHTPTTIITLKDGNEAETTPTIDEKGAVFTPEANHSYRVTFSNKYDVSLIVKKLVDGNMGNRNQSFKFNASVTLNDEDITKSINQVYVVKKDGENDTTQEIATDGSFYLKSGESIVIDNIPYGAVVTITESDTASGYTTTYTDNGSTSVKGRICENIKMQEDHTVIFTNTCGVNIPTGIFNDGKPTGWLFLMAAAGCFAFGFYRRRKKKLNNGEECL